MKKFLYVFLLIALIIPAGVVLAGEPMTFELEFRNRTGAVVSLDMVDANGNHIYTEVPEGVSTLDVLEGKYNYYANTACGVEVGVWNMNVKKVAIFKCDDDGLFLDLDRMCYWPDMPFKVAIGSVGSSIFFFNPAWFYPDNFTHTNGCWDIVIN